MGEWECSGGGRNEGLCQKGNEAHGQGYEDTGVKEVKLVLNEMEVDTSGW